LANAHIKVAIHDGKFFGRSGIKHEVVHFGVDIPGGYPGYDAKVAIGQAVATAFALADGIKYQQVKVLYKEK